MTRSQVGEVMRTGILLKTSEDVLRRLRQTERNGMAHGRSEED